MPQELLLRYSDGYYYIASLKIIRSIHFDGVLCISVGTRQFRPCPVDRKWRKAVFVNPRELTEDQLEQASAYLV